MSASLAALADASLPPGERLRHAAAVAQLAAEKDRLSSSSSGKEGSSDEAAALYLAAAGGLAEAGAQIRALDERGEASGVAISAEVALEKAASYRARAADLLRANAGRSSGTSGSRGKREKKSKSSGGSKRREEIEFVDEGEEAFVMTAPPSVDWSSLQAVEKQRSSSSLSDNATSSTGGALFRILEEAMAATEAAHAAEKQHDFELALREYHRSCSAFLSALEQEQNDDTKTHIRSKVEINMERAEVIKAHLQRKKAQASGQNSGSMTSLRRPSQDSTARSGNSPGVGGGTAQGGSFNRGGSLGVVSRQPATAAAAAPPAAPEPIEVNELSAPFVTSGLAAIQAAKVADSQDDITTAVAKYEEAVDAFTKAFAVETNTKSRKLLNDHMVACFQRAERLRAISTSGSAVAQSRIIPMGMKASDAEKADKKSKKGGTYEAPQIRAMKGKKTWKKF